MFNFTILNGIAAIGRLAEQPRWIPGSTTNFVDNTEVPASPIALDVDFEASEVLYPWSGYLAAFFRVKLSDRDMRADAGLTGDFVLSGTIVTTISATNERRGPMQSEVCRWSMSLSLACYVFASQPVKSLRTRVRAMGHNVVRCGVF